MFANVELKYNVKSLSINIIEEECPAKEYAAWQPNPTRTITIDWQATV